MGEAKRKEYNATQLKTQPIQEVVDKICEGSFDSSHIVDLLHSLRPVFSARDPILYDLSNFIAHPEGRNRGVSFNHIRPYVENFIIVSKQGGSIPPLGHVFKQTDVIQRLCKILKGINLNFDEKIFLSKNNLVIDHIMNRIEETEFKFAHPEVVKCYLKLIGNKMMLLLHFNLKGPVITMPSNVTLQLEMFD